MAIATRSLTKTFGGAEVLSSVDFHVEAGEIHALLGPNGAGKSTLIRCFSGAVQPDLGEIVIGHRTYPSLKPKQAIEAGVAVIYQNTSLIPTLTVAENIFLGDEFTRWGFVRRRAQRERTKDLFRTFLGMEIDPDAQIGSLPVATRQLVEVAKALSHANVKLLILDEPTAALSQTEAQAIFRRLRILREQGLHIIYITHRLQEVFEIADRVTVLRDGRVIVAGQSVTEIDSTALVSAITGRRATNATREEKGELRDSLLTLEGLAGERFGPIDLQVRSGEVVGLFGPVGSGRTELLETVFGARRPTAGRIRIGGRTIAMRSPAGAIEEGVALVPADRLRQALLGELDAIDNVLLPSFAKLACLGFRGGRSERSVFAAAASETAFPLELAKRRSMQLSGGTQQKLIVGRWLRSAKPIRVLLMDEPTQGVDVGTRLELYKIIRESARIGGRAVLFSSSDHEEVVALADRVIVAREGRLVAEFTGDRLTEDDVIHAAHIDRSVRSGLVAEQR